jgi:hypothetical protein
MISCSDDGTIRIYDEINYLAEKNVVKEVSFSILIPQAPP